MYALIAYRRTRCLVHAHREEDGRELRPQPVRANPTVLCCGLRCRLLKKNQVDPLSFVQWNGATLTLKNGSFVCGRVLQ